MNLKSERSEFTYEDCLILRICSLISLGKRLALPNHQFLHLNMDVQCEVWKSMSARPQAQGPRTFLHMKNCGPETASSLPKTTQQIRGPARMGTLMVWV